ncbi:MAG: hypothetical protein EAZ85_14855 [Bacteroidetes bacterium]|nr:MAG: hypothetical protein EAZ85_14855 [Bacteroidota bacterium]TAG85536.1 MAG: hypothetical protein EAZ20_14860 [Bacteroidota bacterium]
MENEKPQLEIHLNGKDFEGFLWRIAELGLVWAIFTYLTGWDGGLIFLILCVFWSIFLLYKINLFKNNAYQQIIEDLEQKNEKLLKSNQLLQNVVQDKMGMRIKVDEQESIIERHAQQKKNSDDL